MRMHIKCWQIQYLVPGTDRVDANGRLGGTVGRLDRLYRLIDPFSTGSIPQKIDRLDRFSIDFRPQKALDYAFYSTQILHAIDPVFQIQFVYNGH